MRLFFNRKSPGGVSILILACIFGVSGGRRQRRRKPLLYPRNFPFHESRMTILNMTCDFYKQPLNHFVPKRKSPVYLQRYCVYDGFVDEDSTEQPAPIFIYTGNEPPLEEYINNTGLLWELAPDFHAQVIFMEHRYEGESLPRNLSKDCMSYSSSIQALADYVALLEYLNPQAIRPVVAFGGSYGGMLSSWLRMKYPDVVAGAIAGSAPIWGFPKVALPDSIDAASRVVTRGLRMPYPPTQKHTEKENHCVDNLLAAWPLLTYMGQTPAGRLQLQESFRLCHPLETADDVNRLRDWAQSPWFDLAEGSFPYPSSYIPFALHMGDHDLPAWPLQAACWTESTLHQDWGVSYDIPQGMNRSNLLYDIHYGDSSSLVLSVDWDKVNVKVGDTDTAAQSRSIQGLLASVRDAVAVWFNVTKDIPCFNITPAENEELEQDRVSFGSSVERRLRSKSQPIVRPDADNATQICDEKIAAEGSWGPLCCNEDINLAIVEAQGLGHDMYWPPSYPRGTTTYSDIVDYNRNTTDDYCVDPENIFGYPTEHEPWSTWLDLYYGGLRIGSHSNIVFSNGLLDPWSAGGVYAPGLEPDDDMSESSMVQNITLDGSIVAILIEFGGHHTDLMYSSPANDPACVKQARRIESSHIRRWIDEWHAGRQGLVCASQ